MEVHGALSTGVFTAVVDQQNIAEERTTKALENVENKPIPAGADEQTNGQFDQNALITPVTQRGTLFDILQ